MTVDPDRIPVIAGTGEIADRPSDVTLALEPLDLMAEAARRADAEARGLLSEVDSIDIVGLVSWRYRDTPALLSERLGLAPARAVYGPVGGESPVRYLHEAARRIASGQSAVGLVAGAEAQHAFNRARRAGVDLPWTAYATDAPRIRRAADYVHPLGVRQGVAWPINVYPLYDVASAHAWGQTPAQATQESATLWAANSRAAARNAFAWLREELAPAAIASPGDDNRMISWPYPKRMVANPNVNQGAAILVTSLAKARAAGLRAAPGPSPTNISGVFGLPTPNTTLVRCSQSLQRRQSAPISALSAAISASSVSRSSVRPVHGASAGKAGGSAAWAAWAVRREGGIAASAPGGGLRVGAVVSAAAARTGAARGATWAAATRGTPVTPSSASHGLSDFSAATGLTAAGSDAAGEAAWGGSWSGMAARL